MNKRNYRFGGDIHSVPASRQNIDPRTPSGVRPVASPVTPVAGVSGKMKNGGEVESMKKTKKMAMGGMSGPMPVDRSRGVSRGSMAPGGPGRVTTLPVGPPKGAGGAPRMSFGPQAFSPDGARFAQSVGPLRGGFLGGPGGMSQGLPNAMMGMGQMANPAMGASMQQFADRAALARQSSPPPASGGMPMGGPGMGAMPRGPAMKKGGKVSASSYRDMTGGAAGGIGRLEKSSIAAKTKTQKLKKGGMVEGYADGGPMTMDEIIAANQKRNPNFKLPPGYEARARLEMERQAADTSPERAAYNARQAKRDKDAAAAKRKAAARKAMSVSRDAGGTRPRGNPDKAGGLGPYGGPNAPSGRPWDFYEGRVEDPEARRVMSRKPSNLADAQAMGGLLPTVLRNELGLEESEALQTARDADSASRAKNPNDRMRSGGMAKMAKGGKAEAFEGTAKDMAQDKKLAKKYGMSKKAYEKSPIDAKHDKQRSMKGLKKGGVTCGGMAMGGGVSTAQDGMKPALRPKPTAMAKGGKVGMTFGKPLPGTKVSSQKIRATTATGASMKKDGMKGQLRAKASGAKATNMMKPLGMTKMASGGKVRGTGCAQRGTKFIGEV
jgi:hypothetical protein